MRTRGPFIAVVLAVLFAPSGASAAVQRVKPVTVAAGVQAAAVDGGHLVAWATQSSGAPAEIVVFDDRDRSERVLDLDRACDSIAVNDGADGLFLVECDLGAERDTLVLNARTRAVISVGDEQSMACLSYFRIGRYWLEGTDHCTGHQAVVYTNWRTGATKSDGALIGEQRTPYDLDSRGLRSSGPRSGSFAVDGALLLRLQRLRGGPRPRYTVALRCNRRRPVRLCNSQHRLRRPTGARARRLGRCGVPCYAVSLEGGLALWHVTGARFDGFAIATARHLRWSLPGSNASVLGATRKRVYYRTPAAGAPGPVAVKSFPWRH